MEQVPRPLLTSPSTLPYSSANYTVSGPHNSTEVDPRDESWYGIAANTSAPTSISYTLTLDLGPEENYWSLSDLSWDSDGEVTS